MNCPNCYADIGDSFEEADPDVGILSGGWYCEHCELFISQHEVDDGSDDHRLDTPTRP